jgi:hypothetical protein
MRRLLLVLLPVLMTLWVHVPDLWWQYHTPAGYAFVGQASFVDQIDLSLYFRCIREGMNGSGFMIPNYADSAYSSRMPLYPTYLLLGAIGGRFIHSPELLFHSAGVIVGVLVLLTVYWFVGLFVHQEKWRLMGWYGVFLGGGLGWLFFPQMVFPDIGVPIFTVWSALRSPHEGITLICLLVCLGMTYCYFLDFQKYRLVCFGLCLFGLLVGHPQTIVPVGIIGLGYGFITIKRSQWKQLLWWIFTIMMSSAVYFGLIGHWLLLSPGSAGLRNQDTYVFPLYYWFIASGVIGLLALQRLRGWRDYVFLSWWFVVEIFLFYFPLVPYRGMMIRGIWVVIVVLATQQLQLLMKKKKQYFAHVVVELLLLISLGDWAFIITKRMDQSYIGKTGFVVQDDMAAYRFLQQQGFTGGMIGTYRTMNTVMGMTRLTPYAGHNPLTPNFGSRYPEVLAFYRQTMTEAAAMEWMKSNNIDWVVLGSYEQALAQTPTLPYSFLIPVWSQRGITIYRPSWALQSF